MACKCQLTVKNFHAILLFSQIKYKNKNWQDANLFSFIKNIKWGFKE